MDANLTNENRYHRQALLPQIGAEGQRRISSARVLLVGCGALGTVIADQLVRAGVGFIRIVDRDVVEMTNLQRQVLFDEEDVRRGLPKAVAAANRLRRVNSMVEIDARVTDVHSGNAEELIGVDVILDGTDNAETRYLINDVAVKHGVPWVYGACVGTEGRVMAVVPRKGPCLRCVFAEPPGVGELATCDTAGVLGPAAAVVASYQVVAATKVIIGAAAAVREMVTLDVWSLRSRVVSLADSRREDCPCCGRRRFEFLDRPSTGSVSLCGRNAVQIRPSTAARVDLKEMSRRLAAVGEVQRSDYMVRCELREDRSINLSLFPDGRLIVHGTGDVARARTIAARVVGV
jgi:adenylyltransferase/sulfurtransferase